MYKLITKTVYFKRISKHNVNFMMDLFDSSEKFDLYLKQNKT